MAAFELAVRLGADGIHTEVRATGDGKFVLWHEQTIGSRFRRRELTEHSYHDLSTELVTLDELLELSDPSLHLSIEVVDSDILGGVIERCLARHDGMKLWIGHRDLGVLTDIGGAYPSATLVHRTSVGDMHPTPERHAADLRARRIDAVRVAHADWSAGLTALFDRFSIRAMTSGLEHVRHVRESVSYGVAALASRHVDRMIEGTR